MVIIFSYLLFVNNKNIAQEPSVPRIESGERCALGTTQHERSVD
jgi:hypothetical protein